MKYTKHPIRTKYLYKSETNGSVYTVITKSSKSLLTEKNSYKKTKKIKLFDDISTRELWSSKLNIKAFKAS